MTHPVVGVIAAGVAVAVAGRATAAVLGRRWVEVLCAFGALALLVLVAAGRVPLAPVGSDLQSGGGAGVLW